MKTIIERIKSPIVIASLISAVALVLSAYGIIPLTDELKSLIDAIGYIVIGVGIFNNPADKVNF